jgi:microcystin-dependent protein
MSTQAPLQIPISSNPPNTSPAAMAGDINGALASIAAMNAGATAPTNYGQTAGGGAGAPVQGVAWLDQTSAAYPVVRIYDGSVWEGLGVLDTVQNVWTPISGGAGSIAAAATTDLGTEPADTITITGAGTITSFGTSAPIGARKQLNFASNPVIQYGSSAPGIITPWAQNLYVRAGATLVVMHLGSGLWKGLCYSDSGGAATPAPGTYADTAAIVAPDGWLFANGASFAKATYPGLYAAIVSTGTATITIASPGVVSWAGHPVSNGDPVKLRTTGALPTGLTAGTVYYAVNTVAGVSFQLAATPGGAAINTSGTQSGTHTAYYAPHGDIDANNAYLPDCRDVAKVGKGNMGGSDRGLIASQPGYTLGAQFGEEAHTLGVNELPSHTHNVTGNVSSTFSNGHLTALNINVSNAATGNSNAPGVSGAVGNAGLTINSSTVTGNVTSTFFGGITDTGTGGGGPHNNLQPSLVCNVLIKF